MLERLKQVVGDDTNPQKYAKQKAKDALRLWLLRRDLAAFVILRLVWFVVGSLVLLQVLGVFMTSAFAEFVLTVIFPILAVAVGCAILLFIAMKVIDAGMKPRFHRWFATYGVQAVATVVMQQKGADADGDPEYFLLFEWQHPLEQEVSSRRVQVSRKHYAACPVGSTHPVLLDPDNTTGYEVYLSQIRADNAMAGKVA